jgi:AraC-like DNA-binding protein
MLNALIIAGWMAQILGVLLIAALLSARQHSIANRLLATGLTCAVVRQFLVTMEMSGLLAPIPALLRVSFPIQMLAIPTFYLYVKALTTPDFKLERKDLLHLIPFAAGLAWYSGMWIWSGAPPGLGDRERYIRVVVKILVVVPYLIQTHRLVRAFANRSKDHVSDLTPLRLSWLRLLLIAVYAMIGIDALDVVTGPGIPVWRLVPLVGLICLMALALFSLRVSRVFAQEVEYLRADSATDSEEELDQKKETNRLPDEQLLRLKSRLVQVLEDQTLYLNPELRLSDLADALDIRPYRVSEILSRGLHTSFYDLINHYRIARAQELLDSPNANHLNLLGIAMESGFKSKSVFNDVFKRTTGKTPSEFRMEKMTESVHSDN